MDTVTKQSIERVTALIDSEWPANCQGIVSWLAQLGLSHATVTPSGKRPTPRHPVSPDMLDVSVYDDRPASVSWFAAYGTDVSALMTGHQSLVSALTNLVGPPTETTSQEPGPSAYWSGSKFIVHTYAHVGARPHRPDDPPRPVLQIHIDVADTADLRDAEARKTAQEQRRGIGALFTRL